jgi:integrase
MPAKVAPLTDPRIRHAKPRTDGKPLKLADGGGLTLWVLPSGRYWRLKYRFGGKEKLLALGVYPEVKAADARRLRDDAKRALHDGRDPGADRKAEKAARHEVASNTFGAWADAWLSDRKATMAPATYTKAKWLLQDVAKPLRDRPIAEIEAADVLDLLEPIAAAEKYETAHRAKQRIGQVFRLAVLKRAARRDPTADIKGELARGRVVSRAAVTEPNKIGELLRAIDGYGGQPATAAALKLAPLLFVRPGELRAAEWTEFDLNAAELRIPAERMKMGEAHVVPLSSQAVVILRELHRVTGHGGYLFPSLRSARRCMSENTINAALRRLGYSQKEMTAHGFRAMASTCLNELGWAPDVIERQLAHAPRNKARASYNRAQHLQERRRMMQAWADYLEALKAGARVVSIGRPAA